MEEKSIFEYFKQTLTQNYANFEGRVRRKEFWSFTLVSFIISIVLTAIDTLALDTPLGEDGILINIFNLAFFVPSIAIGTRRLHDIGKSGWMQLLYFFIIIGWVWLLILFFTEGHAENNDYGQNPKNPEDELEALGTE
jgi:uncharacterized membrane protein YhaH (DUF805 family)